MGLPQWATFENYPHAIEQAGPAELASGDAMCEHEKQQIDQSYSRVVKPVFCPQMMPKVTTLNVIL